MNQAMHMNESRLRNGLFVAPFVFVFVCLLVIPLFWGFWLGLTKADLFGPGKFVGIANYTRLFNDKIFRGAVLNTLYFVVLTVPVLAVFGLALALALNRKTRFASVMRAVFFASSVLSVTVVTLIWRIVFIPDIGLLSNIFGWFGLPQVTFLSNARLALPAVAIATVWWGVGLPMMLFLAALQQVPGEIYEAAALDNAGRWKTLWRITLPSIRRTFLLVLIIQSVLQFQVFGQAQLMTQGGPNNASRPIVLYIYDVAFTRFDVGMGAATSQVLFAIILMAGMLQYFLSNRRGENR
ncbi:ABC transporter permease [Rhizobium sp. AC44/96]|jgi:multiple sugar transport system permease protein|uniref:carbohydrate ABC transporter permease n=1 Tax=Rhizobium sp. AC44/96 TaxID=1841654 RepID=UPI00080FD0D9|nr:sugar ABC transporter permease [Rhizobium sp. AC44/96]OCJ07911.1 ABC transporter permease [Rhizobium sp. AC44/96]